MTLPAAGPRWIAALGAAAAVGLLAGIEPRYGLAVPFGVLFVVTVLTDLNRGLCLMVLVAFLETLASTGGVSLAKLVGLVLALAWIAVLGTEGARARNLLTERPGLTYLLLLFLGWAALSVAWAPLRGEAGSSVMRYALNAVLVPIAYTAVRGRGEIRAVLVALVVGASVAAASGISSGSTADATRATGTVGDANELAAALILGTFVALAFALNRHLAVPRRALAAGAAALCLLGILLSLSRGGLIGLAGAACVAVLVAGRWRGRVVVAVLGVVVAAVGYFTLLASLPAKERVMNVGGGTGRLDLWTVGWRMVEAHPVRGVGTGQFQTSSVHYLLEPGAIERGDFILSTPKVAHNTYLNVLSELGIVGLLLFAAIVLFSVGCLLRAVRELRDDGDESSELLVRGLVAGVGGYLTALMFISENYSKLLWVVLALGPAILAATRARPRAAAGP